MYFEQQPTGDREKIRINTGFNMKASITLFLFLMLTGLNSAAAHSSSEAIGWFHGNCIGFHNPDIQKNTNIALVLIDNPITVINSEVLKKVIDDSQCWPLSADRKHVNLDNGRVSFYKLDPESDLELGIGIITDPANESEVLDINRDGVIDRFFTCTSAEGIHFKIFNGVVFHFISPAISQIKIPPHC